MKKKKFAKHDLKKRQKAADTFVIMILESADPKPKAHDKLLRGRMLLIIKVVKKHKLSMLVRNNVYNGVCGPRIEQLLSIIILKDGRQNERAATEIDQKCRKAPYATR